MLARAEAAQQTNGTHPEGEIVPARERTDDIDLGYFELSHVISAAIAPMLNDEKQLVGAYFAESTAEGFFDGPAATKELAASTRLTEWIAGHTGKTIRAAEDYHSLPFLKVTKHLRDTRRRLTGHERRRTLMGWGIAAAIVLAISLFPKMDRLDGDCALIPMHRTAIVPEIPGRIERVLVREGDRVKAGDPIAQLDTRKLQTELETNAQEKRRLNAEAERYRGLGDEAAANVAFLQARVAEGNEKKLNADIEAATLRTHIDGVVVTKDLELHVNEYLQPGTPFAEVAALDAWEAQIDVTEKKIGRVEKRLAEGTPIDVSFILYSQSAHTFHGQLVKHEQISAQAIARDKENVFLVTLKNLDIPTELSSALRPGLTGRGKIELGRKPLLYLWTSRVWAWLEMRMIG